MPLGLTGTPDGNLYVYTAGSSGVGLKDGLVRIPTASPQNAAFFPASPGPIGLGTEAGWITTGA